MCSNIAFVDAHRVFIVGRECDLGFQITLGVLLAPFFKDNMDMKIHNIKSGYVLARIT